ncbi:MAG: hypothetical protein ACLFPE_00235 [Bacteroidales bacterium]
MAIIITISLKSGTKRVVQNLVHDKPIIVWYDYAFNPEKIRFGVMAGFWTD